jgi:hypothetical protein
MKYLQRGGKRAVVCWHRRSGKDLTLMHATAITAHKRTAAYWHVYPTESEGRKAIWEGFTKDGKRIMEQVFPAAIRKSPRAFLPKAEMVVELKCGSIWRLLGSDRIEVVGAGPAGVVFSEFALAKPSGWNFIAPMLDENDGWAVFASTPRGNNHFKQLYDYAATDKTWFRDLKTLFDTWAYDPHYTLAAARARGMPEALIRQEYLCDWSAALVGSVWGDLIEAHEKAGRIAPFETEGEVFTSWDLGISDSTAIWFWRPSAEGIDFIDYYESHGKPLSHYYDALEQKPYAYARHWLPHDAQARTLVTGSTIEDQCVDRWGRGKVAIVPKLSLLDGIQAGRWLLQQKVRFHPRCGEGLEALRTYHYSFDESQKTFSKKPEHDWSSHCFTGDTLVLTRNGTCRLDMLSSSGEVLTPCGWKRYRNPRLSLRNAPLVAVTFEDGTTVRCTPEHLFLTASGWKSAESLDADSLIQSSLTLSRRFSKAASTAFGMARTVTSKIRAIYTEMFGSLLSARYPAAVTSTIGTGTNETTGWKTSSACPPENISHEPGRYTRLALWSTFQSWLGAGPPNGTAPRKAGYGTNATRNGPKVGPSGGASSRPVVIAESRCAPWCERTDGPRSGAPRFARPLRIASVIRLDERADVWDLTVPGVECFSLVNGAIVHNSADAFRYAAVVARLTQQLTRKPEPEAPKPFAVPMHQSFTLEQLHEWNKQDNRSERV